MATTLAMPKLGVEMEVARLVEWTVEEGAQVADGEIVANLETEKVVYELPTPAAGWIHFVAALDEEYAIGDGLATIAETEAEYAGLVKSPAYAKWKESRPAAAEPSVSVP